MDPVMVFGAFDNPHSPDLRFLQEAARLGPLHLQLWSDELVLALTGQAPRFPQAERRYFLEAVRYVTRVDLAGQPAGLDAPLLAGGERPAAWVMRPGEDSSARRAWCAAHGLECRVIPAEALSGFPDPTADADQPQDGRKKVIVTGCFDWLHSGHVRFFEEAAQYGALYVAAGNDANVTNLKGAGHPLFCEAERRFNVGSIRHVYKALITSGWGWMDAEPEIEHYRPDIYLVNEDGDKPEKQAFCAEHGLEYVVLKRLPKEGLQRRSSTDLRGF